MSVFSPKNDRRLGRQPTHFHLLKGLPLHIILRQPPGIVPRCVFQPLSSICVRCDLLVLYKGVLVEEFSVELTVNLIAVTASMLSKNSDCVSRYFPSETDLDLQWIPTRTLSPCMLSRPGYCYSCYKIPITITCTPGERISRMD